MKGEPREVGCIRGDSFNTGVEEAETKDPLSDTMVRAVLFCERFEAESERPSEGENVEGTELLPIVVAVLGLLTLPAVLGREIELVGNADGVAGPVYGLLTGDF